MRIYELARDLGVSSKELIGKLHDMGVAVKNHMSTLSDEQVDQVRAGVSPSSVAAAPGADESASAPPAAEPEKAKETGRTATATLEREEEPESSLPAAAEDDSASGVETPEPSPQPPPAAAAEAPAAEEPPAPAEPKTITVRGAVIVKDFAQKLGKKPNQLIAELMGMNVFASINQRIDLKVAQQIAAKHGYRLEHEKKAAEHRPRIHPVEEVEPEEDRPEDLETRPAVVAFLGHVDHGKTSLLDYIRKSRVVAGEDGGITQHIGAYTVDFQDQHITFLDTPGHAAFTAMRARGANLTDIVVVVIAADDGIMPQTREAIQHARAADVAIMVAINKVDLPNARPDRVLEQLQNEGLTPEEWGGDVICCRVSAETGDGVDHLLEMIVLQAEMLELKANPKRRAQGYVIEAELEPGRGPTATVLVRRGTLRVGDPIQCGPAWGKVKAMMTDQGIKVRTAGPSSAVKILGLTEVPSAGAEFRVPSSERAAREAAEKLIEQRRSQELTVPKRASLEDLFQTGQEQEVEELAVIIKADVQGSLEAVEQSLKTIPSDKVSLRMILSGVGNITENDVLLASASNAIILGFHVSKEPGVSKTAKQEGVEIRLYSIIYEMIDDVREAMTGLLSPVTRENVVGHARVLQVFQISKQGNVAGCLVTDGTVRSRAKARVQRDGDVIYEGSIASLKRFQNDAAQVREGQECGIRLGNFSNYRVDDVIEFYEVEEMEQQL